MNPIQPHHHPMTPTTDNQLPQLTDQHTRRTRITDFFQLNAPKAASQPNSSTINPNSNVNARLNSPPSPTDVDHPLQSIQLQADHLSSPPVSSNTSKPTKHQTRLPYSDLDPNSDSHFGHAHLQKDPNNIRFYFQNANGLKWGHHQADIANKLAHLQSLQVDFFGIAESNLDFNQSHVSSRIHQLLHQQFQHQTSHCTSTSIQPFP